MINARSLIKIISTCVSAIFKDFHLKCCGEFVTAEGFVKKIPGFWIKSVDPNFIVQIGCGTEVLYDILVIPGYFKLLFYLFTVW